MKSEVETGSENNFWTEIDGDVILTATPTFSDLSRAWSKMWGSRWNRVEIYFRTKVISTFGFGNRHFEFSNTSNSWASC